LAEGSPRLGVEKEEEEEEEEEEEDVERNDSSKT